MAHPSQSRILPHRWHPCTNHGQSSHRSAQNLSLAGGVARRNHLSRRHATQQSHNGEMPCRPSAFEHPTDSACNTTVTRQADNRRAHRLGMTERPGARLNPLISPQVDASPSAQSDASLTPTPSPLSPSPSGASCKCSARVASHPAGSSWKVVCGIDTGKCSRRQLCN